jgi:hypothetical protein
MAATCGPPHDDLWLTPPQPAAHPATTPSRGSGSGSWHEKEAEGDGEKGRAPEGWALTKTKKTYKKYNQVAFSHRIQDFHFPNNNYVSGRFLGGGNCNKKVTKFYSDKKKFQTKNT